MQIFDSSRIDTSVVCYLLIKIRKNHVILHLLWISPINYVFNGNVPYKQKTKTKVPNCIQSAIVYSWIFIALTVKVCDIEKRQPKMECELKLGNYLNFMLINIAGKLNKFSAIRTTFVTYLKWMYDSCNTRCNKYSNGETFLRRNHICRNSRCK